MPDARDWNQPPASASQPNSRPIPQFADIDAIESRGNSNYHSLQARFRQNPRHGITALASYTWSKSIDDGSSFFTTTGDANFPQDSWHTALERGLSDFDMRHRLSDFNLLNRVNLDLPDNFFGSPTFGKIQSAESPRRLQLGVKVVF